MARDYKHKNFTAKQPYQRKSQLQSKEEDQASPLKWVWLMAGVITVGLLGGFFIVQHFAHKGVKSGDSKPVVSVEAQTKEVTGQEGEKTSDAGSGKGSENKVFEAEVVPKKPEAEHKIHYSFYKGLAKTEVVVNAVPISVELPSPYYIQAGTFTERDAALKEQKRLAQFGQVLQMSSIEFKGRTYYRLRMGPFTDRLVMNRQRNELRKYGVDTLLIRARNKKTSAD